MTKKLKKPIAFLTVFAMVMSMLLYFPAGTFGSFDFGVRASAVTLTEPSSGDGSSSDPYILKTKENLYWFANEANYVNRNICARLGNDITVNSNVLDSNWNLNSGTFDEWTPIDNYGGTFDGNNCTISGIYVNNSVQCQGFFGSIGRSESYSGYVQNLTITDSYISGDDYHVGGICGSVEFGTISNCTFKGVVKGTEYVGGIAGRYARAYDNADIINCSSYGKVVGEEKVGGIVGNVYGKPDKGYTQTIKNCENHAEVSGEHTVGGLFGYLNNYAINIENCHNYGNVTAITQRNIDTFIGGICGSVGEVNSGCPIVTVNNCSNSGSITGRSYVGGIFGTAISYNKDTFKNCSNSGSISGRDRVGGLFGSVRSAEVSDCSNTGAVSGEEFVGGICGLSYGDETKFTRVYNTGKITGTVQYIGGLFGKTESAVQYVTESYNTGEVDGTGAQGVGGIIGSTSSGSMPKLTKNCYNTAKITGLKNVGGISGVSGCTNTASVEYCFNTGEVTATGGNAYGLVSSGGEAYVTVSNSYYDVDVNPNSKMTISNSDKIAKRMPTSSFESGEVAYLLQAGGGNWGQRVSRDIFNTLDSHPVLMSGSTGSKYRVYYAEYPVGVDYYHNHNSGVVCAICPFNPVQPRVIDGVYQISDSGELLWFSQYVNGTLDATGTHPDAKAVLTASFSVNSDLLNKVAGGNTANENVWQPIGSTTAFTGSFDGQGHTISGLYCDKNTEEYIGLFAKIGSGGKVTNVGVNDSYFNGSDNVGGIAGQNDGEISNCFFFKGTVTAASGTNRGDICGSDSNSITNCYYLADSETDSIDGTTAKSESSFNSGEVAYKLNDNPSEPVWGQLIRTDAFPVQADNANTVYYGRKNPVYHNHTADMTYCDDCPSYFGAATAPGQNSKDEYMISNTDELYWFANFVNSGNTGAKAVLMNDIEVNRGVLDENGDLISDIIPYWTPIGTDSDPFTGSLDGQCYKISGLYADNSADNIGLFGVIGSGGSVSNVGVIDSYFSGNDYVGGIAGKNNGTITGCFSISTFIAADSNTGGVSGSGGTVYHSFYLSDSDSGEAKTAEQFRSGYVAYNLNSDPANPVWGQLINTDALPVPVNEANRVYFAQRAYHNHTSGTDCPICPVEPDFVDGKYQISTEQHLLWFTEYVNGGNTANAVLKNDIAVSDGFVMTPIGTAENPFNGSFDGKCCGISNLNINTTSDNAGLFGVIGESGSVSNLAVTNSVIEGSGNVGGIAGTNNGKISGCYTFGLTLTGAAPMAGSGTVDHSFSTSITILGAQKTAEQFANGDVAYNLNADPANPVWGQLINSAAEPLPVAVTAANKVFYADEIGYHNHGDTDCPYCPVEPRMVDGVYQLSTENNLWWFAEFVNSGGSPADAVLLNNISFSTNVDMIPIGTQAHPFNGSFNGNGYTISGLNFTDTGASNVGLFGYVSGGSITRLCIADSVFNGNTNVGAVCGYNGGATVSECYVKCDITAAKYAGGICGYNSGTVKDCIHVGDVNSTNAGGIVGNNDGKVTNCINLGAAEGANCDNICGDSNAADVQNCYYNAELTSCVDSLGTKAFTVQLTAEDFLPGAATEWVKAQNDYTNHILYYPILKNVTMDDIQAEYTTAIVIENKNTAPVKYGDDLNFSFDVTTEINGNTAIVTMLIDPTALFAMDFVIEHNGEVLYNDFTVSNGRVDNKAVLWLTTAGKKIGYIDISGTNPSVIITEDLEVGEHTFRITYNGTSIPWFTGTSGSCTVTIVQATPTVEEPTASEIDYGMTLGDSELSDTGWKWVDPDIIPTVANRGCKVITIEPVDYVNYDYSNVEGYDPVTHLITRTIPVTVNPATPTIVVKANPSADIPGKTITVSAVISNPNNSEMTDLPAVSFSYKIGSGAETAITGNSFVIPENTAIGTIIKVIARTPATENYAAGINSANVIVTDCTHENKTLQHDETSHWYHCEYCGADIDIEPHTHGEPVKENEVAATCTTDGSYDEVVYCTVCEAEISRTAKVVPASGHTWAEKYEYDEDGHWLKCEVCGELSEKHEHIPGEPATLEHAQTCTVCGYEIAPKLKQVAAPVIYPNGGTFTITRKVTITCATEGAEIYFTTDGTEPTAESTLYTKAFTISSTTTIKAIAIKEGMVDSEVTSATFTKQSSGGGGGGGGGGRPTTPTEPENPSLNGVSMTWSEIAAELAKLVNGSEVTIELNGNTNVPIEVIKVIANSQLKVHFVVDSTRGWFVNGADITAPTAADLALRTNIGTKTDTLRGIEGVQLTANDTGIPTSVEISFKASHAGKFANLYKSVDGKLVFVTCAKIGEDGKVRLSDVSQKGDYVAMICEYSDLKGDMNNDGVLNAMDASAILKAVVGLETGENLLMADFNGDGKINAMDASAILKRIVGLA